jgi:RNA recognition motif-containing protein
MNTNNKQQTLPPGSSLRSPDDKCSGLSAASGYKVFVGGLSVNCKSRELRQYLEKFGEVMQCDVAGEKEGKSKGFAFATFRTKEARNAALGKNHLLKSKAFEVRELVDSTKNSEMLQELSRRKLYLSNLKKTVQENDLVNFFSKYGKVEELTINRDVETQESKGFGFVMFADSASVHAILGSNQSKVLKFAGSDLIVKPAIPKKDIERQKHHGEDDSQFYPEDQDQGMFPPGLNEHFYQLCNSLGSNYMGQPPIDMNYFNSLGSYYGDERFTGESDPYSNLTAPTGSNLAESCQNRSPFDYTATSIGNQGRKLPQGYPKNPQVHPDNVHQVPFYPWGPHFAQTTPGNSYLHHGHQQAACSSASYEIGNQGWEYPSSEFDNIQHDLRGQTAYFGHRGHASIEDSRAGMDGCKYPQQREEIFVQGDQTNSLKSNSGKFETDSVETTQQTDAICTAQEFRIESESTLGIALQSDQHSSSSTCGGLDSVQLWSRCDECRRKLATKSQEWMLKEHKSIFDFLRSRNCECRTTLGRSEFFSQFSWTEKTAQMPIGLLLESPAILLPLKNGNFWAGLKASEAQN